MSTNGVASSAEQLQERLNDPKVVEGLNRLLDQLDIVSFAVESMEGLHRPRRGHHGFHCSSVADLKGLGNEGPRSC